jgi:hypothetical protein
VILPDVNVLVDAFRSYRQPAHCIEWAEANCQRRVSLLCLAVSPSARLLNSKLTAETRRDAEARRTQSSEIVEHSPDSITQVHHMT